jgi:hypothetical protein
MCDIPTKVCSKCKIEKPIDCFHKKTANRDGHKAECKECIAKDATVFYKKNKERVNKVKKIYYNAHKEQYFKYGKKEGKVEYQRDYRKRHKESLKEYSREYRNKNRIPLNAKRLAKKKTNINFMLACTLRNEIYNAVKKSKKIYKMKEVLGCSLDFLKQHIESQFTEGMTWENHGRFGWHIDQVLPCKSFDLSDSEQQKRCFNWSNLQPLWWYDNISKGAKIVA